jgi:hypothetical protein
MAAPPAPLTGPVDATKYPNIRSTFVSGPTTFDKGRGTCARGNLVREMPCWGINLIECGFHTGPHKIIITTPTGHHYLCRAPDPP